MNSSSLPAGASLYRTMHTQTHLLAQQSCTRHPSRFDLCRNLSSSLCTTDPSKTIQDSARTLWSIRKLLQSAANTNAESPSIECPNTPITKSPSDSKNLTAAGTSRACSSYPPKAKLPEKAPLPWKSNGSVLKRCPSP